MPRTTLTLPDDLAVALDDLLPYAKHRRYIKRSDERNDLIRYLLTRGAELVRAEMAAETRGRKGK